MRKKVIMLMLLAGLIAAVPTGAYASELTDSSVAAVGGTESGSESESSESGSTESGSVSESVEGSSENGSTESGSENESIEGSSESGSTESGSDSESIEGSSDSESTEGESENTDESDTPAGWVTADDGSVYYYVDGAAVTGIYTVESGLYYFDGSGKAVKEQMQKADGAYYYFDSDYKAVSSQFLEYRGAKYYFDDNCQMVTNTTKTIDGVLYSFRADGKVVDDAWKKIDGSAYYFDEDGKVATGMTTVKGSACLFNSEGVLQSGLQTVDGSLYYMNTGNLGCVSLASGLKTIGTDAYYFGTDYKAETGWKTVGTDRYYFGSNYKALTGLQALGSDTYYFGTNHKAALGWVTSGTYCYYMGSDYKALKSTIQNGYKLDAYGRSSTRYLVLQIVAAHTTSSMTKAQKISALWTWLVNNNWTYTRTYEHTASTWTWYTGWTDDFANQLISNHTGNCFRYAAGFGYMVYEATGYEVRVWEGMTPASRGGLTPHGWINVNIDGTWYAYDPDLYKFGTSKASVYNKTLVGTTSEKRYHKGTSYVTIK